MQLRDRLIPLAAAVVLLAVKMSVDRVETNISGVPVAAHVKALPPAPAFVD